MLEKIDFLIRFWELRGRHESAGAPLGQSEQRELLSLLQLVSDDLKVPLARSLAPSNGPHCPALAIGETGMVAIDIRLVTASALLVSAARHLDPHEAVIVRATDAVAGVEYSLPCRVVWVNAGAPMTMALVVDGVPTRAPFEAADLTHVAFTRRARPVFGWPRAVREPKPMADRRH